MPSHEARRDELAVRVGARIRHLRETRGFDFDAFVEESGLGRGHVSKIERGLVSPTLRSLGKLAAALDVTVADLVAGETPREKLLALSDRLTRSELRRLLKDLESRESQVPTA